jgi:hypothetical protein
MFVGGGAYSLLNNAIETVSCVFGRQIVFMRGFAHQNVFHSIKKHPVRLFNFSASLCKMGLTNRFDLPSIIISFFALLIGY